MNDLRLACLLNPETPGAFPEIALLCLLLEWDRDMAPDAGEQISGSRFRRAYCVGCDTPMRVNVAGLRDGLYCERCEPGRGPSKASVLTPRQAEVLGRTCS